MNTESMELKQYEDFLRELAKNNSEEIISNGGREHAVILYSVMLDNTSNQVRILCQSGNSHVWRDQKFVNAMKEFLKKDNTTLKVLTINEPALSEEWTNQTDKVKAYHIPEESKQEIYSHFRNPKSNFAVFDQSRYRYEYDYENFKAFGSFNAPDTASKMIELFDNAFKAAEEWEAASSD